MAGCFSCWRPGCVTPVWSTSNGSRGCRCPVRGRLSRVKFFSLNTIQPWAGTKRSVSASLNARLVCVCLGSGFFRQALQQVEVARPANDRPRATATTIDRCGGSTPQTRCRRVIIFVDLYAGYFAKNRSPCFGHHLQRNDRRLIFSFSGERSLTPCQHRIAIVNQLCGERGTVR